MEIEYYKNLPPELKVFFPRMLDSLSLPDEAFQVLEYYSYPTLAEIYCYEDVPMFVWNRILAKLSRITFEEFSNSNQQANESNPTLAEVFIEKTEMRNSELLKHSSKISRLVQAPELVINGKMHKGVDEVLSQARKVVNSLTNQYSIIHGDFCLSNILCEPDSNNIKLIDPRGGFSVASCSGPLLYDVAKLGHSLIGRYDLIVADKFKLNLGNLENSEIGLEIFESSNHREIENEYLNTYLNGRVTRPISRLLSGLVLLSIPIFHLDKMDRAIAMLLQGIRLTNDALEEL